MKYCIGTGWWCDGSGKHSHSKWQQYVDISCRQKDFFDVWYNAIKKYCSPQKIVIIDSNSPIKPNIYDDCVLINLIKNWGAAADGASIGTLSGWDRSVIGGVMYAILNDFDYFVYIEQDCLVYGKDIIEVAIKQMDSDCQLMLGDPKGTPQKTQQSFMIFSKKFMPIFIKNELAMQHKDLLKKSPEQRYFDYYQRYIKYLPFGYGRSRPIDFESSNFYAQHLTSEELDKFIKKIS